MPSEPTLARPPGHSSARAGRFETDRAARWVLAALVLGMSVSLFWLVESNFDYLWDSTLYVLSTRSLLAGEGYTIYGAPFHLRPPGFSLLLAPVMALAGQDFLAWNLLTSALGILAIALAFLWFRPWLGVGVSAGLCVVLWLNPQIQRICNATLSDTAGLAALFACLLADRWARGRPTPSGPRSGQGFALWPAVAVGLTLGAASYIRSVAALLIPAIALSRLAGAAGGGEADGGDGARAPRVRRELASLVVIVAVSTAVQLPWTVWKRANPQEGLSEYSIIHSYWTALWHRNVHDPSSPLLSAEQILDRVPDNVELNLASLGSRMPNADLHGLIGSDAVEAIRAAGLDPRGLWYGLAGIACLLFVAARRRDAGSLFTLANLALLAIYFDFDDRLLVPIFPFVLAAVAEVAVLGLRRLVSLAPARWIVTASLVALAALDLASPRPAGDPVIRQDAIFRRAAAWVDEHWPDAKLGAVCGHEMAAYFDRPVAFLEVVGITSDGEAMRRKLKNDGIGLILFIPQDSWSLKAALNPLLKNGWDRVHQVANVAIYVPRRLAEAGR